MLHHRGSIFLETFNLRHRRSVNELCIIKCRTHAREHILSRHASGMLLQSHVFPFLRKFPAYLCSGIGGQDGVWRVAELGWVRHRGYTLHAEGPACLIFLAIGPDPEKQLVWVRSSFQKQTQILPVPCFLSCKASRACEPKKAQCNSCSTSCEDQHH